MAFARRDPNLVSQYLCWFCGERIAWGVVRRILRTDPGQPEYMQHELYAHADCLRAALRPEVPLKLARHWSGQRPLPDDSHEIDGKPCGVCGTGIAPAELTRLRVQEPMGAVKRPEFAEESVPVHTACFKGKRRA